MTPEEIQTVSIHWTQFISALGPSIIAVFVAYIAFQQWRTNRATLREKLFDRRFEVFQATQAFLSEVFRETRYSDDAYWWLVTAKQSATFLFDESISEYLEEIRSHATKMQMCQKQYAGIEPGKNRSELVEKEHAELEWLTDQLDPLFQRFRPYFSFPEA